MATPWGREGEQCPEWDWQEFQDKKGHRKGEKRVDEYNNNNNSNAP